MAALYWANSMPQVFLLRLLTGFGMASYGIARHAFVADNIAVASRGRSVALLGGIFRIGQFCGARDWRQCGSRSWLAGALSAGWRRDGVALIVAAIFFLPTTKRQQQRAARDTTSVNLFRYPESPIIGY